MERLNSNAVKFGLLIAAVFNIGCRSAFYGADPAQKDIARLVRTIDDGADDPLHPDSTPSVYKLIEIGPPALEQTLPLLDSDEFNTRMRAFAVVTKVIMRMFGYNEDDPVGSIGYEAWRTKGNQACTNWWVSMGNLAPTDSSKKRKQFIANVRRWLSNQNLHSEKR